MVGRVAVLSTILLTTVQRRDPNAGRLAASPAPRNRDITVYYRAVPHCATFIEAARLINHDRTLVADALNCRV